MTNSKLSAALSNSKLRFLTLLGALTLFWACYPASQVSFSNPQESSVNQWLIEIKTGEPKVQLTLLQRGAS